MKDNLYFLYVGNAYPHKNLKRLVKAIVLLDVARLKIVASRNIFTQRLEKSINEENASSLVEILGYVGDTELNNLYKNSIAFVFPSLSEGFGLPGIEAMRAGTLVLASDTPVFREIYKDNVIYFDPLDVNSIKNAMEKSLTLNPVQRNKILENEIRLAKTYSWAKMAQQTLEVYQSTK